MTNKLIRRRRFLRFISFLLTIAPVIVYIILGFLNGSIGNNITLGLMLICSLCLTVINIYKKIHLRSGMYLILIGLYYCLGNIVPLLVIVAITTIIDELIISPYIKNLSMRIITNKELDRRLSDG